MSEPIASLLQCLEQKNEQLNGLLHDPDKREELMQVMRELSVLVRERRERFANTPLISLLQQYTHVASDRWSHMPSLMIEGIVEFRLNAIRDNAREEDGADVGQLQSLVRDANEYLGFMRNNEHNSSIEPLRRRCIPQRVERWRDLISAIIIQKQQERSNAFMMATHGRLGDSALYHGLEPGLLRMINEFAYK
jgi:hypothetical protein